MVVPCLRSNQPIRLIDEMLVAHHSTPDMILRRVSYTSTIRNSKNVCSKNVTLRLCLTYYIYFESRVSSYVHALALAVGRFRAVEPGTFSGSYKINTIQFHQMEKQRQQKSDRLFFTSLWQFFSVSPFAMHPHTTPPTTPKRFASQHFKLLAG